MEGRLSPGSRGCGIHTSTKVCFGGDASLFQRLFRSTESGKVFSAVEWNENHCGGWFGTRGRARLFKQLPLTELSRSSARPFVACFVSWLTLLQNNINQNQKSRETSRIHRSFTQEMPLKKLFTKYLPPMFPHTCLLLTTVIFKKKKGLTWMYVKIVSYFVSYGRNTPWWKVLCGLRSGKANAGFLDIWRVTIRLSVPRRGNLWTVPRLARHCLDLALH